MKPKIIHAVIAILAMFAWQVVAQPATKRTTSGYVGLTDNPLRMSAGQVMDFSLAIKWYQSNPKMPNGLPHDSPLRQEIERRQEAHARAGQQWSRYLISEGNIGGRLPEGVIISGIRVTNSVFAGLVRAGPRTKQTVRSYRTVVSTKEVLLKNAPENISLPIFAFPAGQASVGNALLQSFDYGKILAYANPATQTQTASSNQTKNASDSVATKKDASATALLKHCQQLAEKGDAYGLCRMGERYLKGDGVEQDTAKARELLQKAVSAGSPEAEAILKTIPQ